MDIRSVGFFHFATDFKGDPIKSLEEALVKYLDDKGLDQVDSPKPLRESLLVIPEAFNLRLGYWDALHNIGCGIRDCLVDLSRRREIAMVAGLLDDHGGPRPANCAYLIDGGEPRILRILSRKHLTDQSENYDPCDPPCDEVIPYRGLRIAALVCMDADRSPAYRQDKRHEDILRMLEGPGQRVLCIPSCFTDRSPLEVVECWPNHLNIVLANRTRRDSPYPSVMRMENSAAREFPNCEEDHVEFFDLPEA